MNRSLLYPPIYADKIVYDLKTILAQRDEYIIDWLIVIPIKVVLRDCRIACGYVVAYVAYEPGVGVVTDSEDEEI